MSIESEGKEHKTCLSLDGGGMRGLLQLKFLKTQKGLDLVNSCDCFTGTSIGGIIALWASMKRSENDGEGKINSKDVEFVIEKFTRKSSWLGWLTGYTSDPLTKTWLGVTGVFNSKYDHNRMKPLLNEVFGGKVMKDLKYPTIITTYNLTKDQPVLMRNGKEKYDNLNLIDVAMCTSAAPTYFQPYYLNESFYVDGGVWRNNPVENLLEIGGIDEIISIGTGLYNKNNIDLNDVVKETQLSDLMKKGNGKYFWLNNILNIMMNGQSLRGTTTMLKYSEQQKIKMMRINFVLPKGREFDLDDRGIVDQSYETMLFTYSSNSFSSRLIR